MPKASAEKLLYLKEWQKNNPEKFRRTQKKYRDKNKEKLRAQQTVYRSDNRDRILALSRINAPIRRRKRIENPQKPAVYAVMERARKKGLPYDKEFLMSLECPEICPVLKTPISFARGQGYRSQGSTASFDEIIGGLGYVPGNVQILSQKANAMKNDATIDELRLFADWIEHTWPRG